MSEALTEQLFKFTELDLQKMLWFKYGSPRELSSPNIYVYGSNESDFLTVTKAGYVDEYEIKLTRSDFKADFYKERHEKRQYLSPWKWHKSPHRDQFHSIWPSSLAAQYPNRFWYVTPHDLVAPDEVPEFAGLIYMQPDERSYVRKQAPLLHREKEHPKVRKAIHKSAYWRYLNYWLHGMGP